MRRKLTAMLLLSLVSPAFGHRLDEYLQATLISIDRDHVELFMRLIPGVAVSSSVLATMHTQTGSVISDLEQRTYAEQVLREVSLSLDNTPLTPRLVAVSFPRVEEIREGTGEVQLDFNADLPPSRNSNHRLVFENHHQGKISAYLVNGLVPQDHRLRIVSQIRNQNQSVYEMNYVQEGALAK